MYHPASESYFSVHLYDIYYTSFASFFNTPDKIAPIIVPIASAASYMTVYPTTGNTKIPLRGAISVQPNITGITLAALEPAIMNGFISSPSVLKYRPLLPGLPAVRKRRWRFRCRFPCGRLLRSCRSSNTLLKILLP